MFRSFLVIISTVGTYGIHQSSKIVAVIKKSQDSYNYRYLCTCDLYSPVHNVLDACKEGSGSVQIITDPDGPKTYVSGTLLYKLNATFHNGYRYLSKNVNPGTDSYLGPLNYLNLLARLAGPHQLNHLLPCKKNFAIAGVCCCDCSGHSHNSTSTQTTTCRPAPPPMTLYFPRQPWRVITLTGKMTITLHTTTA